MAHAKRLMAAAIVMGVLRPVPAPAAEPPPAGLGDEIAKQESIYRSRGAATPDGYVIDRSLPVYAHGLGPGFRDALAELGPSDRWLDIGAGAGNAVLDYVTAKYDALVFADRTRPPVRAAVVALSIEDRRTRRWREVVPGIDPGRVTYLAGRRLREYAQGELGTFRLVTDVVGGFSYAVDLSLFTARVLALLAPQGDFYTLLGDVQTATGTARSHYSDSAFLTEIRRPDGSEVRVCQWLKSIGCVEVRCEPRDWHPPVETYHVRKTCDDVRVPVLLPRHYEAGTPPGRRYLLAK